MISRLLTGILRKHGRISKRALEKSSSTNSCEINPLVITVTTDNVVFYFHAFTIPFRHMHLDPGSTVSLEESLSPSIQENLLRTSNDVFKSVMCNTLNLLSRYTINRGLLWVESSTMIARGQANTTHQTQKPFYITLRRQKNHAFRGNFASELHQVIILHLSRVGLTS
jgi:hypothetical protein